MNHMTRYDEECIISTCSACDQTTVRQRVPNERDIPCYASLPIGWMYDEAFGYLCPTCAAKFKNFINGFLDPDKIPNNWKPATF